MSTEGYSIAALREGEAVCAEARSGITSGTILFKSA